MEKVINAKSQLIIIQKEIDKYFKKLKKQKKNK